MSDLKKMLGAAQYANNCLQNCATFVPEEKKDFKPSETAKSATELLNHGAQALGMFTLVLNGEELDFKQMHGKEAEEVSFEEAKEALKTNWDAFEAIAKGLSNEDLKKTAEMPWGKRTYAQLVEDVMGEQMYHFAQLQYLQTIWADMEDHFAK